MSELPHSNLNKVSQEKTMRLAPLFVAFLMTASTFSAAAAEPRVWQNLVNKKLSTL